LAHPFLRTWTVRCPEEGSVVVIYSTRLKSPAMEAARRRDWSEPGTYCFAVDPFEVLVVDVVTTD
jgi:hypothetical protein